MCESCWREEYAAVAIDTPEVRDTAEKIRSLTEAGKHWPLHLFVADWNLDDLGVLEIGPAEDVELCRRLAIKLAALNERERASALALAEGWWGAEPPYSVHGS